MLSILVSANHRTRTPRRILAAILLVTSAWCPAAARAKWQDRIFPYDKAETARQLARKECKPLVLHFVPDDEVGFKQFHLFYTERYRVPDELLNKLVIVVIPSRRFAAFKNQLGVKGAGGYRTISAYDLEPFNAKAVQTCHTGFR